MSEINIQNAIRLAVSKTGKAIVLRNNTGLFLTLDGTRTVRAGLGKGTSDLIGFIRHRVRPEDVGREVAVFFAGEVKDAKGKASDEQSRFLQVAANHGAVAGVIRSPEDALSLVERLWDSPLAEKNTK
jgi:hypothetical protein